MKLVFFGTPEWAVPSLRSLLDSEIEVQAVVTNPDRPSGRGMKLQPSPVKQVAAAAGLDVLQPEKARDPEFHDAIRRLGPDVAAVVAYGKILPVELLEIPGLGFVNVHFSLLPAYRGAAPVQRAVMDGLDSTGVSIMVLTEGMDEGPVLAMEPISVGPTDTAGYVGERLAEIGGPLLVTSLLAYAAGELTPIEQDHEKATYAPKITPTEARIDWSLPAERIDPFVRGLQPVPGAWTQLGGKRLKVIRVAREAGNLPIGELGSGSDLVVGTGSGALRLDEVQPEGKKKMTGQEFLRGLRTEGTLRFE